MMEGEESVEGIEKIMVRNNISSVKHGGGSVMAWAATGTQFTGVY